MLIRDLSGNAVRQVSRNRRRYKVVVWFICSGIAGLISMVTIGKALQERIGRNLELIGKATIIKAGWDFEKRTRWHHREFRTEDVEELKRLAAVSGVTAFAEKPDHVFTLRERKAQGRLVAVDQHFFSTLQLGLSEGRPISDEDLIGKKHVCVVGKNLLEELCGQNGGQPRLAVCVEGVEFEVIGVLGGVEDREHERSLFIPMSVAKLHFAVLTKITGIYVRAKSWSLTSAACTLVSEVLRRNHAGYEEAIEVRHNRDKIQTIQRIEFLVSCLVYVSLCACIVLGGLGVTNLMLSAIRDRTAEIGLRKAVGATDRAILFQFLLEATAISILGAAFGIVWGWGVVEILKHSFGITPDYDMLLLGVVSAAVAGIAIGILSGLTPAIKASRLDPADAMRFE